MRLENEVPLEEVKAGKFACVKGQHYSFFSLITDLSLEATNHEIMLFPPTESEGLLGDMLRNRDVFAKISLKPMLMLDANGNRMPVKTIPQHFSSVHEAQPSDIAMIFGDEKQDPKYFNIGAPLDMEDVPVCLDFSRFTERSNGIFGKSGTGKTFITRVILAGTVQRKAAVNLIFDMHSEYGLQARCENKGTPFVKGLKTLFPSEVAIFSLDPESTRKRGGSPDVEVTIGLNDIRVEDVMPLADELNLHSTALEAAYLIINKYGSRWLSELLSQEGTIKEFAENIGAHTESVGALYRKLKRLERFPFIKPKSSGKSVIDQMIEYLDRGLHVILEFGNHTSMLCYLLIASMVTRRIHARYVEKTEAFLASQLPEDEPKKLMITIEEAHKFLNPQAAKQTIFGKIAREMRKYYVSLLIVDQRPSGIDDEVLSQIGTKVVAQLNDDRDIQAVLTGVSNASGLRSVLATLDSKKQALFMGHALAMPIVVRTREYDEEFYNAVAPKSKGKTSKQSVHSAIQELF
ncbi:ATP-binding protein [bacterium]|nr:ATP-binding protein [bacterium]